MKRAIDMIPRVNLTLGLLVAAMPMTALPKVPLTQPAYVVSGTGVLQKADLLAIVRGHLRHPKIDPFTGEYTSSFKGRQFKYVQTLMMSDGEEYPEANARWHYDLESKMLHLSANNLSEIEFFYFSKVAGHYTGKTAMGAKARVTVNGQTVLTLSATNGESASLSLDMLLPPEEARSLASSAVFVVEGTLDAPGGVLTDCDWQMGGDATLTDPRETIGVSYHINAVLARLTFVDTKTGKLLAEWPIKGKTIASLPPFTGAVSSSMWLQVPSSDDLADLYPDRAQRLEKAGAATISCEVRMSGSLRSCEVVSESPSGYDFGQATIHAASRFRLKPGSVPEGTRVTIPLNWSLKPTTTAPY